MLEMIQLVIGSKVFHSAFSKIIFGIQEVKSPFFFYKISLSTTSWMQKLLGSDVDKLSKILIKTSNAAEFIESDIQNIEAPRTDDPII